MPNRDDPAEWQFAEFRPARDRMLALAVHLADSQALRLDVREARPEEIAAR